MDMIFNLKNILITPKELTRYVKKFNSLQIYQQALTHRSYVLKNGIKVQVNDCPKNCVPLQPRCNERLEYLGDSVLNLSVASYLFERYNDQTEGFLTKMRTKLVNGRTLSFLSGRLGISKYILLSSQLEKGGYRTDQKVLEDTLEALIAAIYIDMGFDFTKDWIIELIENNIDFSQLIIDDLSFKEQFVKLYEFNNGAIPIFNIELGKITKCQIKDKHDNILSTGKGNTKKDAENNAARKALVNYKYILNE